MSEFSPTAHPQIIPLSPVHPVSTKEEGTTVNRLLDSVKDLRDLDYSAITGVTKLQFRRPNHREITAELAYLVLSFTGLVVVIKLIQHIVGNAVYDNYMRVCAAAKNYGSDFYSSQLFQTATLNDCTREANSFIGYLRPFGTLTVILLVVALFAHRVRRFSNDFAIWDSTETDSTPEPLNVLFVGIVNRDSFGSGRDSFAFGEAYAPMQESYGTTSHKQQAGFNATARSLVNGLLSLAALIALVPATVFIGFELLRLLEFIPVLFHTVAGNYMPTGSGNSVGSSIYNSIPLPTDPYYHNHGDLTPQYIDPSYNSNDGSNWTNVCGTGGYYNTDTGTCVYK